MNMLDLQYPDCHYWHAMHYEHHRKQWIANGDSYQLRKMLECIYYGDDPPMGRSWSIADRWNDGVLFGELIK